MSVILFLVILLILVLVHEWGHFIAAKKLGMRVDEFGVGFPPKLAGFRSGETEYTINALPFGGFVRIFGEDVAEGETDPRAFSKRPKVAQAIVLLAGVFMNIVLAWVLFTAGFMIGMPQSLEKHEIASASDAQLIVGGVLPGSPAEAAGLAAGDRVRELVRGDVREQGIDPETASAFIAADSAPLSLIVTRGTEDVSITVTPAQDVVASDPDRFAIGVSLATVGTLRLSPLEALIKGTQTTYDSLIAVAVGLWGFFANLISFKADLSSVTGPVGIASVVGDASAFGLGALISLTAFISLNLAVINVLPFPALDGGRLLFLVIETFKGSPIKPALANALNFVGFALLILLMLVVTANDIAKLFG